MKKLMLFCSFILLSLIISCQERPEKIFEPTYKTVLPGEYTLIRIDTSYVNDNLTRVFVRDSLEKVFPVWISFMDKVLLYYDLKTKVKLIRYDFIDEDLNSNHIYTIQTIASDRNIP